VIEVSIPPPPPSDRKFAYLMAGLAVMVLGVAGIVAWRMPKEAPKVDEKPYEPPVRPTAATAPSDSAYKEPEEVTIDIRVTPPDARLFVDGVKVTNPHRTHVVPASFQHVIRAEADGFETRTMNVAFDKERSVEIALVPAKDSAPSRPGPKPSGAPHPGK
jgi:hypothetical protein